MKKTLVLTLALLCGGAAIAIGQDRGSVVSWPNIVGVITAPGVDNPVAGVNEGANVLGQIHSGTLPWATRSGSASVDLTTGSVRFDVKGLVLIGGNASGTPGPINEIVGTLVCNPGNGSFFQRQTVLDTPPVSLSDRGDARFEGDLTEPVPSSCSSPLFLIRIGPDFGDFAGRWLATGVQPRLGDSLESRGDRDRGDGRR